MIVVRFIRNWHQEQPSIVLYTSEAMCAYEEYTAFLCTISQHIKKTRKSALREGIERSIGTMKMEGMMMLMMEK